jgi:hypothetical protein
VKKRKIHEKGGAAGGGKRSTETQEQRTNAALPGILPRQVTGALRRAEKAEDTLLRSQIESIQATAKSLMPEGLEMELTPQQVYNVIAYLRGVAAKKG